MPQLSVIIPTFNEEQCLPYLLEQLAAQPHLEIIIADAGSQDQTLSIARNFGATCVKSTKGRGQQMNAGARQAQAPVLLFLHADSQPPFHFFSAISNAINQGYTAGCFQLQFDWEHWFLKLNAWFTRFNVNAVRFGDQGLFIKRQNFEKLKGFKENWHLMEDQDLAIRARKEGRFIVLPLKMKTSARKYRINGVFYLQWVYWNIWWRWKWGYQQNDLLNYYRQKIKDQRK